MISANMDFRRKINSARPALNWRRNRLSLSGEQIEKPFKKVNSFYDDRNVVANNHFTFENDVVSFFKEKSEFDLKLSYADWSADKFARAFLEMHTLANNVAQLEQEAGQIVNLQAFAAEMQAEIVRQGEAAD